MHTHRARQIDANLKLFIYAFYTGNCYSSHHVRKADPEGRRPAKRRSQDWTMWEHGDQQWVREHQTFIITHLNHIKPLHGLE